MSLLYETAKFWVDRGIGVIPILYRDKRPDHSLLPRDEMGRPVWEPYQRRLPGEDELKRWFPSRLHNLAVLTGWRNLVVVDFDDAGIFAQWQFWATRRGGFTQYVADKTYKVKTPRGMHVYIRLPHVEVNRNFEGIDIKAAGGYVLAPPSVHPSGVAYEVVDWDAPILEVDALSDILPAELMIQETVFDEDSVVLPGRAAMLEVLNDPWVSVDRVGRFDGDLIKQIRESIDLLSFFPDAERTSGDERWYRTVCPFHQDRHPSFWIDRYQKLCGCFASCTPKPLDVINLYARLNGVDNRRAILSLSRLL